MSPKITSYKSIFISLDAVLCFWQLVKLSINTYLQVRLHHQVRVWLGNYMFSIILKPFSQLFAILGLQIFEWFIPDSHCKVSNFHPVLWIWPWPIARDERFEQVKLEYKENEFSNTSTGDLNHLFSKFMTFSFTSKAFIISLASYWIMSSRKALKLTPFPRQADIAAFYSGVFISFSFAFEGTPRRQSHISSCSLLIVYMILNRLLINETSWLSIPQLICRPLLIYRGSELALVDWS